MPDCTTSQAYTRRLPTEILGIIFQFCNVRERIQAAATCQRWRRIAESHRRLWTHVHVSTSDTFALQRRATSGHDSRSIFAAWTTVNPSVPNISVHHVGAIDRLLSHMAPVSAQLYISALTLALRPYLASLRAVLAKNAGRLASVTILFDDLVNLHDLDIFPGSSCISGIKSLHLLHVNDYEFARAGLVQTFVEEVELLPPQGQHGLQELRTPCCHSWEQVPHNGYPHIRTLNLHVFDVGDIRAAMHACPRLETLVMRISGSLDVDDSEESLTLDDVPLGLKSVSVSGAFADETCAWVLATFAKRAHEVVIECTHFWSGVTDLFGTARLTDFSHLPWGHGMQKLHARDVHGYTCEVRAKIGEDDTDEWIRFYKSIRVSVMHIPGRLDDKVPKEYLPLLLDPDAEVNPSREALTWFGQLFTALDDSDA